LRFDKGKDAAKDQAEHTQRKLSEVVKAHGVFGIVTRLHKLKLHGRIFFAVLRL